MGAERGAAPEDSPEAGRASGRAFASRPRTLGAHVPLGQIADIRVASGPPMIRDEGGMLVGYVYVDMDPAKRDIGGYVDDAKRRVAHELRLPAGYSLQWTGQYELLEQMQQRMRFLVPLTLAVVVLLLYLSFGNFTQAMIVLASVPFALVGSV
jgi:Cu(I)/Ag(I) efflux system membrane protein CusA/SilA